MATDSINPRNDTLQIWIELWRNCVFGNTHLSSLPFVFLVSFSKPFSFAFSFSGISVVILFYFILFYSFILFLLFPLFVNPWDLAPAFGDVLKMADLPPPPVNPASVNPPVDPPLVLPPANDPPANDVYVGLPPPQDLSSINQDIKYQIPTKICTFSRSDQILQVFFSFLKLFFHIRSGRHISLFFFSSSSFFPPLSSLTLSLPTMPRLLHFKKENLQQGEEGPSFLN